MRFGCVRLHGNKEAAVVEEGSVVATPNVGAHHQLRPMYEHLLQRSASRLVVGPFGGVDGRDFACVLSLDGTLSVFEQESFAFARFLPGAVLPGPIAYVPYPTDAFVTASSAYLLEVYRYRVLAVAGDAGEAIDDGPNVKQGKRETMDWYFELGETALDISVVTPVPGSSQIYVLGERHLFCLKDTGVLKSMKKMEFSPSCFHLYIHGPESAVFVLIGSHSTNTLMVYRDVTLKWASQLDATPIAICRTNLRTLGGAIVTLSDDGRLACSYLGTNPSIFTPPPALESSRPIDYKKTDKELAEMHRIINASQKSGTLITRQTEALLKLDVTVVPVTASSVELKVQLRAALPLENVQVTCHFENSLIVSPPNVQHGTLGDAVASSSFRAQLSEGFVPSTLSGTVAAVYTGVLGGHPCIVRTTVHLPLSVAVRQCPPQKDADFKITIGVHAAIVKLDELFPEFVDSSTGAGQVMGFQYHHDGPIVTILVAKTSQRYRFQSDSFGAISLLVHELTSRLERPSAAAVVRTESHRQPTCVYSSPLPLTEFFFVVNGHLQVRHKLRGLEKRLAQLAAQFRAIQKRLLSKFRDKTTTPFANLDTLLESTHGQIMSTATTAEECERNLRTSLCLLKGATRFLCLLVKLYANLHKDDYDLMASAVCPQLEDEHEQGWEEMVTSNVMYLLETKFVGQLRDLTTSSAASSATMPNDIGPVKAAITTMVERLARGVDIREESAIPETDGENGDVDHSLPFGSSFGQRNKTEASSTDRLDSRDDTGKGDSIRASFDDAIVDVAKVPRRHSGQPQDLTETDGHGLSDTYGDSFF